MLKCPNCDSNQFKILTGYSSTDEVEIKIQQFFDFICANCQYEMTEVDVLKADSLHCDEPNCWRIAIYEGWYKVGDLNRKGQFCKEHYKKLLGFKNATTN